MEDGKRALQGKRTYNSWQEGLEQIFKAVLENKPFIMNVYRSVSKEQIESYLYKLTFELIEGVVNEKAEGTGMQEDYSTIVKKMSLTLHGNISNSIGNFLDEG